MEVTLQYFDGCPHWKTTRRDLNTLIAEGLDITVDFVLIDAYHAAEEGFRGSPTVLIDGADAFDDGEAPVGLHCRIYDTERGPAGSPTIDHLRAAIRAALTRS